MANPLPKMPLLVVIYPYKFSEFLYTLLELDCYPPYCEVVVWDISQLVNLKFSNAVTSEHSQRSNVVQVSRWRNFFRQVSELRHRSKVTRLYIFNYVVNSNLLELFSSLTLSFLLRKNDPTFIQIEAAGILRYYPLTTSAGTQFNLEPGWLAKLRFFTATLTTFTELIVRLQYSLVRALAQMLPDANTFRLVAGQQYLAPALRRHPRAAKLVFGHSEDYSRYLIHTKHPFPHAARNAKLAVLLESNGPMFAGDTIQMGSAQFETIAMWYPSLTKFIDQLELATMVRVEIAGHYKSAHPSTPDYYGKRHVRYGETQELVRNSEFVIVRTSTATSFAVLYRKPIIFIYSNQTKNNPQEMLDCWGMASFLGTKPINIDQPPWNFAELLQVNETRYAAYEKACLTSAGSTRPNSQIILEDIMKIPVSPRHYTHAP